jgi:PPOX class probable F420-dependent enzyme
MVLRAGATGSAGDTAAMESFFALLQHNILDRRRWDSRDELRIAIVTWIERTYHRRRRQVALGRLSRCRQGSRASWRRCSTPRPSPSSPRSGPKGEPQTTPIWFIWKDGAVHLSLVDGRQKLRNLRRDPRASVVIVDPAEPTRYVELRGRVHLVPDPQLALEREVAIKYRGAHVDVEPPGTMRFAARLAVDRVTSQADH